MQLNPIGTKREEAVAVPVEYVWMKFVVFKATNFNQTDVCHRCHLFFEVDTVLFVERSTKGCKNLR